ncbi:MAG: tetratricopeptide repeat protein [Phycisphaeraceae bacterium]
MPVRFIFVVCVLSAVGSFSWGCGSSRPAARSDAARSAVVVEPEAAARAQALADKGAELKRDGFNAQALEAFTSAVEENPKLTEAHLGIGDIFREREVYDQADRAYRRAVVSDPNNFDARYLLGLTNQLSGDLPRAIASYERALRIRPNSYKANRDMGTAVLQSGRPAEAVRFAKKAVDINPDSQMGWANLAAAYSLTGDYENAVEAYRQTLELGDAAKPILLGLADAHLKLGNFQRAENVLRAIERDGGDPIARERMGLVLFKLGKFEEATEAYGGVLADNPQDTAALNGLGISLMAIYLRDGLEDEAVRVDALGLWRRSLSIRPDQSKLIDLIARYSKE